MHIANVNIPLTYFYSILMPRHEETYAILYNVACLQFTWHVYHKYVLFQNRQCCFHRFWWRYFHLFLEFLKKGKMVWKCVLHNTFLKKKKNMNKYSERLTLNNNVKPRGMILRHIYPSIVMKMLLEGFWRKLVWGITSSPLFSKAWDFIPRCALTLHSTHYAKALTIILL